MSADKTTTQQPVIRTANVPCNKCNPALHQINFGTVYLGVNQVALKLERTVCRRTNTAWATPEQSERNKKRLTNAMKRVILPKYRAAGDSFRSQED